MIIAINAGHCPGLDPGAVGQFLQEADVARDVARVLCADLDAAGYNSLFIQEDDLGDVCDIANNAPADLFVSIHLNAANRQAEGTETFYYEDGDQSEILARCIQTQLVNALGTVDRGIKARPGLWVINSTNAPAVLVEICFIDNTEEEQMIAVNKENAAHAIARGITDYLLEVGA